MSNDIAQSQSQKPTTTTQTAPSTTSGGTSSVQLKAAVRATEGYDAQAALLQPVQRHGGKDDTSSVHAAAAHGISGSGGAMPHGGKIQQAFGGYDISNVTAHTDSAAAQGAAAMGADAYATGSSIAFKGAPDLHTAAHEAAHVVQQQSGVSLSGGVGKAGDGYEQHADKVADAVVAGKSAEPILSEMAGGGGGGDVQKKAVQRVETSAPTTTPHGDAALTQVGAGTTPAPEATPETEASAPVYTVPQAYDPYCTHIRTTFAADIATLRDMQVRFKATTSEVMVAKQTLQGVVAEQAVLQEKYDADKKALTEEEGDRLKALTSMLPYEGKTMEQLYKAAKKTVATYAELVKRGEGNRKSMEGIMQSAMELLGQVDKDSAGFGRNLYSEKIDKEENGRLVTKAEQEGMPPAENAALAVNFRTWARVFFRAELMTDDTCTEILFMRDLVNSGREAGESPETLIKKVFNIMKADMGLKPEDTFDEITEEQKLEVYAGMIAKAKETNKGVNGSLKQEPPATEVAPISGP